MLLGSIFCAWLAISSNRIFFSRYAISALHLEPEMAGRLMGLFALAMLVGSMPAGLLGARLGRRRMMQAGLLLGTGAMAANTLVHTVALLCVAQALGGLSLAFILVNALPLVLDYAPPHREGAYTGLFFLAMQLAEILGPILSGSVLHLSGNARVLFIFAPAALLLSFACLLGVRRGSVALVAPAP